MAGLKFSTLAWSRFSSGPGRHCGASWHSMSGWDTTPTYDNLYNNYATRNAQKSLYMKSTSIGNQCACSENWMLKGYILNASWWRYCSSSILFSHLNSDLDKEMNVICLSYPWDFTAVFTAKTKCGKFETNIPRRGISGPQSQFPHSCVCERIIYSHDGSACSAGGNMYSRLILWIYKSLKDTWMWKLGLRPRYSQKRNI